MAQVYFRHFHLTRFVGWEWSWEFFVTIHLIIYYIREWASSEWIMIDFKHLLWTLHEIDEIHSSVLKIHFFLLFFNDVPSKVIWYFMIIVQGSERIHVGMRRKRKFAKMKIWCLDSSRAIIYSDKKLKICICLPIR